MALKFLYPSDTAFAMAVLSAQMPRLEQAFSTLQPILGKINKMSLRLSYLVNKYNSAVQFLILVGQIFL